MSDETADLLTVGMAPGEGLVFAPPPSPWCKYQWPQRHDGPLVFLHLAEAPTGRVTVNEARVSSIFGLSDSLRSVPIGRVEAALNRPSVLALLRASIDLPALSGAQARWPVAPDGGDVDASGDERGHPWWRYGLPRPSPPRLKLKVPATYRKPDAFYSSVAEAFSYLAATTTGPAQALADANDVPVTTVHGWVKEARRRGLLPPGERSPRTLRGKS